MRLHMGCLLLFTLLTGALVACGAGTDDGGAVADLRGPGSSALDRDDPTCSKTSDCASGEECIDGLCQLQRCAAQAYASAPPLGKRAVFGQDRELLVLEDGPAYVGYEPMDRTLSVRRELGASFTTKVLDAAGGNFTGARTEGVALALAGAARVTLDVAGVRTVIPLSFVPVAVGAGDVDGDGTDEIVALSGTGDLSVCRADAKCTQTRIDGVKGKDVAVADVDGDGRAEPIVLADRPDGKSSIYVVDLDTNTATKPAIDALATGRTLTRLTTLDLDGKLPAEIVALEDGGYGDFVADTLRIFGMKGAKLAELGSSSIAKDAIDVLGRESGGSGSGELLVLEKSGVEVFRSSEAGSLVSSFKSILSGSTSPVRLAQADVDGDSPTGTLVGDAQTVPGPVVPLAVLAYPPYSRTYSDGSARVVIGNRESRAETEATTLALRATLAVGFEAEVPGVAKVSIMPRVEASIARTSASTRSVVIGDRFEITARPELEGPDNGVAMLATACYHAYTYRVDDPAGRLGNKGGDGRLMSLFVPVGGQTSTWSLKRYNALARRLGTLPTMTVPYRVGDPKSYPTQMVKLDGTPVPAKDLLFTSPHSYTTSDVASVGFSLDVSQSTVQTEATTVGVALRGRLAAGPVTVEAEVGASKSDIYTVSVGREASFSGTVPPVRNDARTPEDDSQLHGYGFSPIVYRERYTTPDGAQGGYYVMTYSVTPRN